MRIFLFSGLVFLLATGCANSKKTFEDIVLANDTQQDFFDNDITDVQEVVEDVGTDIGPDIKSDPGQLTVPVEPAKPPKGLVIHDHEYSQEFNHTWNEQEWQGPLVALVVPPASYGEMKTPWFVTASGVVIRNQAGKLEEKQVSGEKGLFTARAAMGNVYLASPGVVYLVDKSGNASVVANAPKDAVILRISGDSEHLDILTSAGPGLIAGFAPVKWDAMNPAPTAARRTDKGILFARPGKLVFYSSKIPPYGTPKWSVDIDVGTPVAILLNRTLPQALDIVVAGDKGVEGLNLTQNGAKKADVALFHKGRVPLTAIKSARSTPDGGFIVAATGGAWRLKKSDIGIEYRVYVADRWMPGTVRDALETTDGIWFATNKGPGSVTIKSWRLRDKMDAMVDRIVRRHDRDGAVADSHLTKPGDLSTNIPWDSDNDGGWTCYWLMAECLRYRVTADPQAKAHFDESLARMLSLRTLTGTDYFVARSVIRIDGCKLDDCDAPDDGKWFKSPDGKWWVKRDTSNDEVDSHMFMMGMAYDLCADEAQKKAIAAHVAGIIGGIIDHDYQLIDPITKKCTTYGQFGPKYANDRIDGSMADGGTRSAELLGGLSLAWHMTGEKRFLDAKNLLITKYHYDKNVANMGDIKTYPFCAGSGDCDELGTQALFTLIRYESDPTRRALWMQGWNRMYEHLKLQEDAFWGMINVVLNGSDKDLSKAIRWFDSYPVDLIRWVIHNEKREDKIKAPEYYTKYNNDPNRGMRSDGHIFPEDERPNDRHNTPRFKLNGGLGATREMDSADVLFAWWMGIYYGFIEMK